MPRTQTAQPVVGGQVDPYTAGSVATGREFSQAKTLEAMRSASQARQTAAGERVAAMQQENQNRRMEMQLKNEREDRMYQSWQFKFADTAQRQRDETIRKWKRFDIDRSYAGFKEFTKANQLYDDDIATVDSLRASVMTSLMAEVMKGQGVRAEYAADSERKLSEMASRWNSERERLFGEGGVKSQVENIIAGTLKRPKDKFYEENLFPALRNMIDTQVGRGIVSGDTEDKPFLEINVSKLRELIQEGKVSAGRLGSLLTILKIGATTLGDMTDIAEAAGKPVEGGAYANVSGYLSKIALEIGSLGEDKDETVKSTYMKARRVISATGVDAITAEFQRSRGEREPSLMTGEKFGDLQKFVDDFVLSKVRGKLQGRSAGQMESALERELYDYLTGIGAITTEEDVTNVRGQFLR